MPSMKLSVIQGRELCNLVLTWGKRGFVWKMDWFTVISIAEKCCSYSLHLVTKGQDSVGQYCTTRNRIVLV